MKKRYIETPQRSELVALNPEYARKEKLIRMHAGCSSEPLGFKNGVVDVEIRLSDQVFQCETKRENVVSGLMENWMRAVPDAECYRAHMYLSGRAQAGFSTPVSEIYDKNGKIDMSRISSLVRQIKERLGAERIDVKVDEREWLNLHKAEDNQADGE